MIDFNDLKRSIRRRYEFIEFQLSWGGMITRKMLQDQFSISPQQATIDLGEYQETFPENMRYNPRQRAYIPSPGYQPRLTSGDVSEYLMHLEVCLAGYRGKDEIWPVTVPTADTVAVASRAIKPEGFRLVLEALRNSAPLKAKYTSLSSPDRGLRLIVPTALACDGFRWHTRAYDVSMERYSDFVLSRLEPKALAEEDVGKLPRDDLWEDVVRLQLRADEGLEPHKRAAIESEYRMRKGIASIPVRKAMLFYYLRYYGFNPRDLVNGLMVNRSSFELQVANLEEVEGWLGRRS